MRELVTSGFALGHGVFQAPFFGARLSGIASFLDLNGKGHSRIELGGKMIDPHLPSVPIFCCRVDGSRQLNTGSSIVVPFDPFAGLRETAGGDRFSPTLSCRTKITVL